MTSVGSQLAHSVIDQVYAKSVNLAGSASAIALNNN